MDIVRWLFDAQLVIGDQTILWREVIGNVFGLLSARRYAPEGLGVAGRADRQRAALHRVHGRTVRHLNPVNLLGQAGRQVMFIIVSVYGWYRWTHRPEAATAAIEPRWASWRTRGLLVLGMIGGTAVLTPVFRALGSYEPVWSDAWIFVGSLLATYGMAKGWVEFWLIWVAVDLVGVPLLFSAGYYASGLMYVFYGAFTLTGFFVWLRQARRSVPPIVTVG